MKIEQYEEFMEQCRLVKKLTDSIILIQMNSTGEYIVIKTIEIGSKPIHLLEQILVNHQHLFHQHLLTVFDFCVISNQKIDVLFEYSSKVLLDDFQIRRKNKICYSQKQLESIIISVAKGLKYLEENFVGHGCLSLKDIYFSENGCVKLVDPCLSSNSPFLLKNGYFYSPQLLSYNVQLKKRAKLTPSIFELSSFGEQINFFSNDIFCLGLIILQLGLLQKYERISQISQSFQEGIIYFQILQNLLNQFEDIYGSYLTTLLSKMLQETPKYRVRINQILDYFDDDFSEYSYDKDLQNYSKTIPTTNRLNQIQLSSNQSSLNYSKFSCFNQNNEKKISTFKLPKEEKTNQKQKIKFSKLLSSYHSNASSLANQSQESLLLDNTITLNLKKTNMSKFWQSEKSINENSIRKDYLTDNIIIEGRNNFEKENNNNNKNYEYYQQ